MSNDYNIEVNTDYLIWKSGRNTTNKVITAQTGVGDKTLTPWLKPTVNTL